VTYLVELVRIERKDSDYVMRKFTQCLWPKWCVHDPGGGGEFTGDEFQTLKQNCHIRDTTAKNPQ
jgi:hypothetical protein